MKTATVNAKLAAAILALAVVGGLLIAYLWETMNRLMAGHFDGRRLLISVPAAIILVIQLRYVARTIERWHSERDA